MREVDGDNDDDDDDMMTMILLTMMMMELTDIKSGDEGSGRRHLILLFAAATLDAVFPDAAIAVAAAGIPTSTHQSSDWSFFRMLPLIGPFNLRPSAAL